MAVPELAAGGESWQRLNRTCHVLFGSTLLALALLSTWALWPARQLAHEQIAFTGVAVLWSQRGPRIPITFALFIAAVSMLYWVTMRRVLKPLARLANAAAALTDEKVRSELPCRNSSDELGLLARALEALHRQWRDDARRHELERCERAKRDHETLRVIGHDIRSPIQALLALNPPASRSWPFINRINKTVQSVFGPDALHEVFGRIHGTAVRIDLPGFLSQLAANAAHVGIDAIEFNVPDSPASVELDDDALSEAFAEILRCADRLRYPGSAIRIYLAVSAGSALVTFAGDGPTLAPEQLEDVFRWVGSCSAGALECLGPGLFRARELLLGMHGMISVSNHTDGVEIQVMLPLARSLGCEQKLRRN